MTNKSRATESLMDELHGMQAESLLELLRSYRNGEIKDYEGNALRPPAALLQSVSKFLKDNGIDRPYVAGDSADKLADELDEFEEHLSDNVTHFPGGK